METMVHAYVELSCCFKFIVIVIVIFYSCRAPESGKWQMVKALKEAPEIVVATPGRMIDMLVTGATNMRRCTITVIDGRAA